MMTAPRWGMLFNGRHYNSYTNEFSAALAYVRLAGCHASILESLRAEYKEDFATFAWRTFSERGSVR